MDNPLLTNERGLGEGALASSSERIDLVRVRDRVGVKVRVRVGVRVKVRVN